MRSDVRVCGGVVGKYFAGGLVHVNSSELLFWSLFTQINGRLCVCVIFLGLITSGKYIIPTKGSTCDNNQAYREHEENSPYE